MSENAEIITKLNGLARSAMGIASKLFVTDGVASLPPERSPSATLRQNGQIAK